MKLTRDEASNAIPCAAQYCDRAPVVVARHDRYGPIHYCQRHAHRMTASMTGVVIAGRTWIDTGTVPIGRWRQREVRS